MTEGNILTLNNQNRSQHKRLQKKSQSQKVHTEVEHSQVNDCWRRVISSTSVWESTVALGMSSRTRWSPGNSSAWQPVRYVGEGIGFHRDLVLRLRLKCTPLLLYVYHFETMMQKSIHSFRSKKQLEADFKPASFPIQKVLTINFS